MNEQIAYAREAIDLLENSNFDELRGFPAMRGDARFDATLEIAKAICAGADLDMLAAFPQDYVYKRQSLLHLLATTRPMPGETELFADIERAVELLVIPGADGACRFDLEQTDGIFGYTALHYVVAMDNPRLFQILLWAGASLTTKSDIAQATDEAPSRNAIEMAREGKRDDILHIIEAWQARGAIDRVLQAAGTRKRAEEASP